MNRLDRLTAILIHLQTKRIIRAQELADRFEISLRTVYRDIRALEEAGVPIGAEAGVGYFLEEYHLPPVMLTNAEASALVFGAKLLEKWGDQSLLEPFNSALYKIKSVLKRNEKDHLEEIEPHIGVSNSARPLPFSDQVLNVIQAALGQRRVLRLDYISSYTEGETERDVEPIGLYHYGSGWHLIAFCRLRQDYRDFRTDRIRQVTETGKTFSRQNRLTLSAYLDGLRQSAQLQEAVVWFDKEMVRFSQQQKYGYGFVEEEVHGDRVRVQFLTQSMEGLSRWLLMFGNKISVECPDELTESLRKHALEIHHYYNS